jgi:diaminopimelate decarboxylase
MKIRIGDRVRTKRAGNCDSGLWGTVVRKMTRYVGRVPAIYLVWLDDGGGATIYNTEDFEKLPRYRGIAQARDTKTAMKHLQEYMQ